MVISAFIRMLMLKKSLSKIINLLKKMSLKNGFGIHLPVFIQSIYFNHPIFLSHCFSSASLSPYPYLTSLCRMNIFFSFFLLLTVFALPLLCNYQASQTGLKYEWKWLNKDFLFRKICLQWCLMISPEKKAFKVLP